MSDAYGPYASKVAFGFRPLESATCCDGDMTLRPPRVETFTRQPGAQPLVTGGEVGSTQLGTPTERGAKEDTGYIWTYERERHGK